MKTNFDQIVFNKEQHSYTIGDQVLTPVSRVVDQVKPPFDSQVAAQRAAIRDNMTVSEVLAKWDRDSRNRLAHGDRVHTWIAGKLRGEVPVEDPFLRLNGMLPEMRGFEQFWEYINPVDLHQVEWVVGDADLGIAGTLDCIFYSQETGHYHLWDWKTGLKFKTSNQFQKFLLPPFDDLDDCELNVYSLQISLYRLLVERNTDLITGDSYILHLPPDGTFTVHKALDLRERLETWLSTK